MVLVVRPWLAELTFKQQTVLLSALRGCDGIPKEDISKVLTRRLRGDILLSTNTTSVQTPGTFMSMAVDERLAASKLIRNFDHYPVHWLLHFVHAVQILAYYHPSPDRRAFWGGMYGNLVDAMHFRPEHQFDNEMRLCDEARETP